METEVQRLVALGAIRVQWDYPDGADLVLADTDGNLFCVIARGVGSAAPQTCSGCEAGG